MGSVDGHVVSIGWGGVREPWRLGWKGWDVALVIYATAGGKRTRRMVVGSLMLMCDGKAGNFFGIFFLFADSIFCSEHTAYS